MSKKATEFQRKAMSRMYRGKEIFKPLNTGWIDHNGGIALAVEEDICHPLPHTGNGVSKKSNEPDVPGQRDL